MTASVLSPGAAPFHPSFEPVHLVIYNDGVPTMSIPGGSETQILHGIQDDAIDERFPPDAVEAAELEAVETYVDMLATFSLMEEREEKARESFIGLAKRWKARREAGLLHRPRPAKHLVESVKHYGKLTNPIKATDLVPFNPVCPKNILSLEHRERQNNEKKHTSKAAMKGSKNMGGKNQRKPLQQPRKHY